ncbi:MAG TPA: acetyltransferase [Galbitalea sp.]|jgi:sugar O-acyltransferase (sialic acid O-acetyltransferase NeuD family)|nr:acetyltransferase [Galbitalea sp.]
MRPEARLDFSRLYVFGAGGHGREIAWLAERAWREIPEIVFLVDDSKHLKSPVDGYPVRLLEDEELASDSRVVVAVGDPKSRRGIANAFEERGVRAATIVDPTVTRSGRISIGDGAVVFPGCVLTTDVTLGRHVHVNVGCTVSHDSRVGDFSSISPGVHIAGNVRIGETVFVGVGANIINGLTGAPLVVGDRAVIAAGACVIGPVDAGSMVAGVPAVKKR